MSFPSHSEVRNRRGFDYVVHVDFYGTTRELGRFVDPHAAETLRRETMSEERYAEELGEFLAMEGT